MARIREPRVRVTSATDGTLDMVLGAPMWGSLGFSEIPGIVSGDEVDYVIQYGNTFEEGAGNWVSTGGAYGTLERAATTSRSKHANGTVDTNPVSFASGVKTIILTVLASRAVTLDTALRYDAPQSLTDDEKAQARSNANALRDLPTGTKMLFQQTSAPVGWTKDTTHNDKALRVVSGTVGSGGSSAFSTVFSKTATDDYTLTTAKLPIITPAGTISFALGVLVPGVPVAVGGIGNAAWSNQYGAQNAVTGSISFSGTPFGSGQAHPHGMDIRVQYVDLIIASKD